MNDNPETVIETYGQDCRILHEERDYPDQYHFEGSRGRLRTFENLPAARLYADLYTITGGFDEKQTGERGVPPKIVRASEDIRMTYLAVQMSITYAANAFEVKESAVKDAIERIHVRAENRRSHADDA